MTALNIAFNVVLIRGLGPIPSFGTAGAAMGTALASGLVAAYAIVKLWRGGWVVRFPRGHGFGPDWAHHPRRCSGSACRPASRASR